MSDDDVIARSDALDEKIAGSSSIHALEAASRRNLRLIRLLVGSVVFDILLSVGLGYETLKTYQLAQQASSLERQARVACLAGNDARAGQVQLWGYILDLPPASPPTPEQAQQRTAFRAYLNRVFAPRRC